MIPFFVFFFIFHFFGARGHFSFFLLGGPTAGPPPLVDRPPPETSTQDPLKFHVFFISDPLFV